MICSLYSQGIASGSSTSSDGGHARGARNVVCPSIRPSLGLQQSHDAGLDAFLAALELRLAQLQARDLGFGKRLLVLEECEAQNMLIYLRIWQKI